MDRIRAKPARILMVLGGPLTDELIEPTNNFAERLLRPAVIARKVSQCSKTRRGANAYAAFKSVLGTVALRHVPALTAALVDLFTPMLVAARP